MEKEVEANERVLSVKVKKEVEKAVNEVFLFTGSVTNKYQMYG